LLVQCGIRRLGESWPDKWASTSIAFHYMLGFTNCASFFYKAIKHARSVLGPEPGKQAWNCGSAIIFWWPRFIGTEISASICKKNSVLP
jgi:hypothetical protein